MSLAAPWALLLAVAAAAAVVLLHLLARRRRSMPLPTARFVPDAPASASARAFRPAEPLLLLLRVLAVLLIGAAFAGPGWPPERQPLARVVLLDVSRAVADRAAARDSAAAWLRPGDVLVAFDSVATDVPLTATDSLPHFAASTAPGSLGAALLAGYRAATRQAERADSVELVLVSPLVAEQWDPATARIRELWPGRVRLVRLPAAEPPAARTGVDLDGPADDPLAAVLALMDAGLVGADVRIRRETPGQADLRWAREPGHVLIHWPAAARDAGDDGGAGVAPDSAGAVVAGEAVVVAPFARGGTPAPGRAVARWVDGSPAATEHDEGGGCVREVRVPLPVAGDLVLRESMRRFVGSLLAPCGGAARLAPLEADRVAVLAGRQDRARYLPRPAHAAVAPPGLGAWLLASALVLLLLEMLLRRRRAA